MPAAAVPTGKNPPTTACTAARLFFPQSKSLGIDQGSFSPGLLQKIVYAGANSPSFRRASNDLRVLAEVTVAVKQVERLTQRIGQERQQQRDAATAAYQARTLTQRDEPPPDATPPSLAVVEMDGGRLQIRTAEDESEPTPAAVPVADKQPPSSVPVETNRDKRSRPGHWREDKVGCLLTMTSEVHAVDPCPQIPSVFVDPLQALKLAQQIGHCSAAAGTPFTATPPPPQDSAAQQHGPRPGRPEVTSRRVVASRKSSDAFAPLLASAAWSMGLFQAPRRAFLADGAAENWSVYHRYFSHWTAVLDFLHALSYVYAAALAARTFAQGWPIYERWIGWVWAGQVDGVIAELTARQQQLGPACKDDKEGSPRRVVQESLTYLRNHRDKMDYAAYRRQGLPLMSSHVESTVKQINYRVKGTEKFWSEEGAEALLQLRADYLSDEEPMESFWQRRQAAETGQRRYRRRTA
jgi:hypothetical protein